MTVPDAGAPSEGVRPGAGADDRRHGHVFGQDRPRPGERRTRIVIVLTAAMMVFEIAAGLSFGSMALLADGLHMASHTAALGITALAYAWVRRHAADERFSFGAGKMNALAGFAGAVLLAGFAIVMAWESLARLVHPVPVRFGQAIAVAVLGLAVNAVSALAGGALIGWAFLDPLMGVVGAVIVSRWSVGLLRESGRVLLDRQAPAELLDRVRSAVEARAGDRVTDLHVWRVSPEGWSAIVSVVSEAPLSPDGYRALLPADLGLAHVSVEVHARASGE